MSRLSTHFRFVLAFLLSVSCRPVLGAVLAGEPAAPLPLHVVHTLKELRAEPACPISGGAVHLGISAGHIDRCDAVVVYCLWEGEQWPGWPKQKEPLGPMTVQWVEPRAMTKLSTASRLGRPDRALFAVSMVAGTAGHRALEVRNPGDRVVAHADIQVSDHPAQSWRLLSVRPDVVSPLAKTNMVPTLSGVSDRLAQHEEDGTLPLAVPARPTGLRIHATPTSLVLDTDEGPVELTERHYVARFWINNGPVAAASMSPGPWLVASTGPVRTMQHLEFTPDWPTLIGTPLHRGDRITVQVLYTPDGAVPLLDGVLAALQSRVIDRARLSDQITFTWPGESAATRASP